MKTPTLFTNYIQCSFGRCALLPVLVLMACFGLLPEAQAVSPAPDGGYPGGNTGEGQNALFGLTSGGYNTAVGYYSLTSDSIGEFNTGVGAGTLFVNTIGAENTATGAGALLSNTDGILNTANGVFALAFNTDGQFNTAVGVNALFANTVGSFNTAIGREALDSNISGIGNVALGNFAGFGVVTANNVICIGNGVTGVDVSNSCFIGNIYATTTINNDAIPVLVDSAGQLGTASSSRRYKTDIKPMDKESESVLALKPVSFRYKVHKDTTPQFGLIAEEVAKVNPNLVVDDANGKPYTVRYEAVNAMLLNEFLKEHKAFLEGQRKVQEQQATITQLKSTVAQQQKEFQATIAQLTKRFDEQASQIQRVSAQLEVKTRGPRLVGKSQ